MKHFLFIVLACISTIAASQETESRNVATFTGVKVATGIDIYLKKGDKESVKVEALNTGLSNVITEVSGSYLKVHMRDGNYPSKVSVKVYVTFVKINKLTASSAGSIFSESTIKADDIEINVVSAGTIEVTIDAGSVDASASAAGDLEIKGKAKSLVAEVSTAGVIDAYDLETEEVEANASTGGAIKVNVSKSLEARASTGGTVRYRGNPDKSVTDSSTGGSVKKSS